MPHHRRPFVFEAPMPGPDVAGINERFLMAEDRLVPSLADAARLPPDRAASVQQRALSLVQAVRSASPTGNDLDALLQEYSLGTPEGVVLMCLAEALLRIPDARTADRLIADKIGGGDWEQHLGGSSWLVNASTWGLMLTGRLVAVPTEMDSLRAWLGRLVTRIGEPVVRSALRHAMRILAHQFVMGRTIEEALQRAAGPAGRAAGAGTAPRYSFDMLGEAAITAADAGHYFAAYRDAIAVLARAVQAADETSARPGISVKLSALHPRYEPAQRQRVLTELTPRLLRLVREARAAGIGLTIDAEEVDRLELSLALIDAVLADEVTAGYAGFGLAVQAYQKRALSVLQWLATRARELGRRLNVRLVKGAYWDSEIKRAQERGLSGYPVFTRKENTDVSYLACVQCLARSTDVLYPQFATHNAHTVAYVLELLGHRPAAFEFQRLHGMGAALYAQVLSAEPCACRVYAPVGPHEDLLPYLVRRLLENGANTSFVNRIVDARLPATDVVRDPVEQVDRESAANPFIVEPDGLYQSERRNSRGINLADTGELAILKHDCERAAHGDWTAGPLIDGRAGSGAQRTVHSPADGSCVIGTVVETALEDLERAFVSAVAAQRGWDECGAAERATILERAADAFEQRRAELLTRCVLEAGKTLPDAASEVREAIDYLRYYAAQARRLFAPAALPGPTGERNELRLRGRGVFACISPWNFPVAIFTGQVAAALAAGNAVLAKPAEQTPLTAALAVELLQAAGVPAGVLQFLPGEGPTVGAALARDPRTTGVVFTGSLETARLIERTLAARPGPIATLIAETGGVNVMLVDSSALPEQVVPDVMASGFNSAGQRCSALRVLLVQEEIAPRILELLAGAMDELQTGDPALLDSDVGPVIDDQALETLAAHASRVTARARWHHRAARRGAAAGRFFAPMAVEIPALEALQSEVFGPIVHVVRYRSAHLDEVLDGINRMGYGLTLGIHTRIEAVAQRVAARVRVGNIYVNRNMIGAVVGVQPFGGCGLSGTGPKAGGPHYLLRFVTEQTVTTNTAAVGGNATLLSLSAQAGP
jgi:RHH-type proline utilization regulon transcriptional repressor/proline dehydrogenase/delta 1-pyrroline-5-carboxylate dehydrogenase